MRDARCFACPMATGGLRGSAVRSVTLFGLAEQTSSLGVDFWAKALRTKEVGANKRLRPRADREGGGAVAARDGLHPLAGRRLIRAMARLLIRSLIRIRS